MCSVFGTTNPFTAGEVTWDLIADSVLADASRLVLYHVMHTYIHTYMYYKVALNCSLLSLYIYSCHILSFTNRADSCCIFCSLNSSQDWVRFEVFKVVTIKVTVIMVNNRGSPFLWTISIYCIYWNIRPQPFTILSFQGNTCTEHVDPLALELNSWIWGVGEETFL